MLLRSSKTFVLLNFPVRNGGGENNLVFCAVSRFVRLFLIRSRPLLRGRFLLPAGFIDLKFLL